MRVKKTFGPQLSCPGENLVYSKFSGCVTVTICGYLTAGTEVLGGPDITLILLASVAFCINHIILLEW